jgi:hypothetical protein
MPNEKRFRRGRERGKKKKRKSHADVAKIEAPITRRPVCQ